MPDEGWRQDTQMVHSGEPRPRIAGAVVHPIFQSATYESIDGAGYDDVKYLRVNNTPSQSTLGLKLAILESAEAGLVTASGMAAITTSILSVAGAGEHILFSSQLYGGTRSFVDRELPRLGIGVSFLDPGDPHGWDVLVKPRTRAIYVETVSNPTMRVPDLESVVAFGRKHGLVTIIDNTFASPVNFRPPEIGFDISLHSATKYLNGHSDIVAGAVLGRARLVESIRKRLNLLGGALDPHACFLLGRGIATLGLRVRRQSSSALALARLLKAQDPVIRVNYPGLPDDPGHERARNLFDGFGGMLSFELAGGRKAADRFISALELPVSAPSLGGVHSLVTRPAATTHGGMPPEERMAAGVPEGLIRLSVGIEAVEDLATDIDQALRSV